MTFEEYVINTHAEQYVGAKDDMPDSYDRWVESLGEYDWLLMGQKYALQCVSETVDTLRKDVFNE